MAPMNLVQHFDDILLWCSYSQILTALWRGVGRSIACIGNVRTSCTQAGKSFDLHRASVYVSTRNTNSALCHMNNQNIQLDIRNYHQHSNPSAV